MPSLGTSVPSPSVLSVIISQLDSPLQNVGKLYSDVPHSPFPDEDFNSPFDFCDEPVLVSNSHLISISDDGKIWNWLLTAEDTEKEHINVGVVADASELPITGTKMNINISSKEGTVSSKKKSTSKQADMSFKVCLPCNFFFSFKNFMGFLAED